MSYSINLLILKPRIEHPGIGELGIKINPDPEWRSCIIWEIDTIIQINRVLRPMSKEDFQNRISRDRASLYFVDNLWPGLTKQAEVEGSNCFAPPFSIVTSAEGIKVGKVKICTIDTWRSQFQNSTDPRSEFIEPLWGASIDYQIPTQRTMEGHNKALLEMYSEIASSPVNLIISPILVWFPCAVVGEWLSVRSSSELYKSRAEKDPEAFAYLKIWETCLNEMGKVGAKCLFIFEYIRVPTVL